MTQREFIDFIEFIEILKRTKRHCWKADGERETVADHTWRLAFMPMLLEKEFPEVDINKVIKMCLIHDFGEAITGDIPVQDKTDADEKVEKIAVEKIISMLPKELQADFRALFNEMEALETKEAKLYKALDKLEGVIAHNESDCNTWGEKEFSQCLTYGNENVEWNDWLKKLRKEIYNDSKKKIEEYNISNNA